MTIDTGKGGPLRQERRLRWKIRLGIAFFLIWLALVLAWLLPLGLRFPVASIPGILAATIGYGQAKSRGLRATDEPSSDKELSPLETRTILWGMLGGGIGYAILAAFRIGVPSPDAALAWRLLGGLVFGSVAGIAAGVLIPILELIMMFRYRKGAA